MSKENSCGMNALAIFTQESGGEPLTMSSREIAELTGKEHKHVMRDVRTLIDELSMSPNLDSCVKSTTYKGKDGRQYDQYELDKDTCLTLLLGYDAVARMKVVKRWRELEEFVAQPALNPDNLSRLQLIQAGLQAALQTEQERLALENKVDQLQSTLDHFVHAVQNILQSEPGKVTPKGFPAFREAQASLAKAPSSLNPAPQSKLSTFEFEGCTVRVVTDATGETRFVGKDVCQVLGFRQHSRVIHESCRGEMKYHHFPAGRGKQPHRLLSEADVFLLVDKSVSPSANTFWQHLQDEFLPGLWGRTKAA